MLQSLGASAAGALTPSHGFSQAGQRLGSAANRAQIVDADFDVVALSDAVEERRRQDHRPLLRSRLRHAASARSCYHHPLKTLTKAELTAIENAGLSVFVVFQHCGAQCVNFDLQNKETADKGRKDAEGAVRLAQRARPARRHADLFRASISIRTPGRDNPLPAARIWPSIEAYFDQVEEVLARHALAGRRLWRRDHLPAPQGERQGEVFLAVIVARPCRIARVLQRRAMASVSERHRDQAELRAQHVRHRRGQSGAPYFGQWTSRGPAMPHNSDGRGGYPGEPRLREERHA